MIKHERITPEPWAEYGLTVFVSDQPVMDVNWLTLPYSTLIMPITYLGIKPYDKLKNLKPSEWKALKKYWQHQTAGHLFQIEIKTETSEIARRFAQFFGFKAHTDTIMRMGF